MTPKHQIITSRDGTKLWAEAAGDPSKPAVIFVHGFAGSASHFEVQFSDVNLLRNLHLVGSQLAHFGSSGLTAWSFRFGTTFGVMDALISH
jgi:pimeloyl-ACP methyl ester carboxylesterase